jgi:hypothetical protein
VLEEFWIDAYVDPDPIPTAVNQIWTDLADEGMVWGVTEPISAGGMITLTVNDEFYISEYSSVDWPLAVGTPFYVQLDSWNTTTYGAIQETHEVLGTAYNNVSGTTVTGGTSPVSMPNVSEAGLVDLENLPPRP